MADLEKNLSEAIEEVLDEAQQPDSKADKGDQKPVKQGSSDAEKIEGGKGEVVKPEENPVDKAVDSVKSASNVKGVSNDPQQKGASKAEPQPKLKKVSEEEDSEESKPSKMEMIKAMVNAMKGMDKESLQAMYSKMSEDDDESVDESLSKAEIARSIVELMKKKDEEEVEEGYKKINAMMKKEEEEDEDDEKEDEDQKEMMMKKSKKESVEVESDLVEMEVEDDLEKISEALELSEENQEKARTIFKAAVSSKVEEIKEQLSQENEESLKSSIEQVKGDLSEAVDKYLSYVAEEWSKENELAIERGLRSEMTDNFIDGLKTLFVEHYVEVPEDKYNVMDELANRLDEMEDKLDSEVSKNMELSEELDSMKRDSVVREACKDLSESQQEKLVSLAKGVDFTSTEDFSEKVSELKEAYFPADSETIAEETVVEEGTGDFSSDSEEKVLAPEISQYMTAISKLKPLG